MKKITKQVLVADDEEVVIEVLTEYLENFNFDEYCIEVTSASDGGQAMEALSAKSFDLVFVDLHMPVMSGTDLISAVRKADHHYRDIPFVVVRGVVENFDLNKGSRELENVYFVEKPFSLQKLKRVALLWLKSSDKISNKGVA